MGARHRRELLTDLLNAINGDLGVLEEFTRNGDSVTVAMTQVVPRTTALDRHHRPQGRPKIPRRIVLSYAGGTITGDTTASVSVCRPASGRLRPARALPPRPCIGEIEVSLPFVEKSRKVVKDQIVDLFNGERDETVEWERRGGA